MGFRHTLRIDSWTPLKSALNRWQMEKTSLLGFLSHRPYKTCFSARQLDLPRSYFLSNFFLSWQSSFPTRVSSYVDYFPTNTKRLHLRSPGSYLYSNRAQSRYRASRPWFIAYFVPVCANLRLDVQGIEWRLEQLLRLTNQLLKISATKIEVFSF